MKPPLRPEPGLDRRAILGVGGLAALAGTVAAADHASGAGELIRGALPWQDGDASPPPLGERTGASFLTTAERAFVTAAADRLIPADDQWPGASQAGVVEFIDRQLAGAYGQGDHLYLGGPWPTGTPSQGYQSRFAPALYYRHAIAGIERTVGDRHGGKSFAELDAGTQDALLRQLEAGQVALDGVDAKQFFQMLLDNVKEGYFADPVYGGNRGMAGWRMIGFPGARYDYSDWVDRHGERVPYAPVGLTGRDGWRRG